jgi:ribosomal protein S19E (S16A)
MGNTKMGYCKKKNPPLPAFFCSRVAAVFRQGFISPKIGIYPVSIYQERKRVKIN